jgi:hypothetical protein
MTSSSGRISVQQLAPHSYRVTVTDGPVTTNHTVQVPADMQGGDEEHLVRRSFEFLLERERPTSILATFSLDVIGHYFPDYRTEIERRS